MQQYSGLNLLLLKVGCAFIYIYMINKLRLSLYHFPYKNIFAKMLQELD